MFVYVCALWVYSAQSLEVVVRSLGAGVVGDCDLPSTEPNSKTSARATNALNHWTVSPAPSFLKTVRMYVVTCGVQKRASVPLELELPAFMNNLMRMVGNQTQVLRQSHLWSPSLACLSLWDFPALLEPLNFISVLRSTMYGLSFKITNSDNSSCFNDFKMN